MRYFGDKPPSQMLRTRKRKVRRNWPMSFEVTRVKFWVRRSPHGCTQTNDNVKHKRFTHTTLAAHQCCTKRRRAMYRLGLHWGKTDILKAPTPHHWYSGDKCTGSHSRWAAFLWDRYQGMETASGKHHWRQFWGPKPFAARKPYKETGIKVTRSTWRTLAVQLTSRSSGL